MAIISVIIPTFKRPRWLAACLESLARQRYPKEQFEVIVVDDGGGVDLGPIIEPLQNKFSLRLVTQDHAGPGLARNNGAAQARGQFIAFTDDDCAVDENWLVELVQRLQLDSSRMYGGYTVNALEANVYSAASQSLIDYLYGYYNSDPKQARFFTSNNMALSRDMFELAGGFDENFRRATSEDRELCDRWLQLGHGMTFVPVARVRHSHDLNFCSFWRQHFNYGRGAWRFWECKHAKSIAGPKLEPPGFYLDLLHHVRRNKLKPALPLSLLLLLSQLANATGFAWAKIRRK